MSKRYKGAILSSTPPTTSTSSASGVWTEQQFMQGVASGSWPALAGAPTIGTATAGALNASVTFTAPTYTGSGITGYTVTSNPGGITGTGASSPITVSGLTAGTAYTFTVTATTAAGQSSASAASNSVTPTAPNYIEDVYSTYLYNGDNSNPIVINNGIDISGQGGLIWLKGRTGVFGTDRHELTSTNLTAGNYISSNNDFPTSAGGALTTIASNGFTLAPATRLSFGGGTYVSWTFRKQPKFFDVVTYTGTGVARTIAHSLGSVPGCIIIKRLDGVGSNWYVYHRANTSGGSAQSQELRLNNTNATNTNTDVWNNTAPTSAVFSIGAGASPYDWNASGGSYVAYLFAHDAGGFGLTGTDNVISCGSAANGNSLVTLGYEPQWVLIKGSQGSSGVGDNWLIADAMRGMVYAGNTPYLAANLSSAENFGGGGGSWIQPTATGFQLSGLSGTGPFIYIAIRRGPMKVPTSGTSVFSPNTYTGNATARSISGLGFPPDLVFPKIRDNGGGFNGTFTDRLRGATNYLVPNDVSAEATNANYVTVLGQDGFSLGTGADVNRNTSTFISWNFRRAPSFFDEVCYTGNSTANTQISHNLGVIPELMIVKNRTTAGTNWLVYSASLGATKFLWLNAIDAPQTSASVWSNTAPTSSVFTVGTSGGTNTSPDKYVAYLFATCSGVSKVGSYTGTGGTQTIDCGFTGGARWVMVKRTDSTGDWYVWDTARGMVSGTDPSLSLNTTAAEVNANSVYTTSVGFQIVSTAAGINASGGTYIFLAIA